MKEEEKAMYYTHKGVCSLCHCYYEVQPAGECEIDEETINLTDNQYG